MNKDLAYKVLKDKWVWDKKEKLKEEKEKENK